MKSKKDQLLDLFFFYTPPVGLEPTTSWLTVMRYYQLSYGGIKLSDYLISQGATPNYFRRSRA